VGYLVAHFVWSEHPPPPRVETARQPGRPADLKETAMNTARTHRRLVRILAAPATAAIAFAGALPARATIPPPDPSGSYGPSPQPVKPGVVYPPGYYKHPPLPARTHAVVTGGVTTWHMILILAAAALLAAALAFFAYRLRVARRPLTASGNGTRPSGMFAHSAEPAVDHQQAQAADRHIRWEAEQLATQRRGGAAD
jgi:hypothetical protein